MRKRKRESGASDASPESPSVATVAATEVGDTPGLPAITDGVACNMVHSWVLGGDLEVVSERLELVGDVEEWPEEKEEKEEEEEERRSQGQAKEAALYNQAREEEEEEEEKEEEEKQADEEKEEEEEEVEIVGQTIWVDAENAAEEEARLEKEIAMAAEFEAARSVVVYGSLI